MMARVTTATMTTTTTTAATPAAATTAPTALTATTTMRVTMITIINTTTYNHGGLNSNDGYNSHCYNSYVQWPPQSSTAATTTV